VIPKKKEERGGTHLRVNDQKSIQCGEDKKQLQAAITRMSVASAGSKAQDKGKKDNALSKLKTSSKGEAPWSLEKRKISRNMQENGVGRAIGEDEEDDSHY